MTGIQILEVGDTAPDFKLRGTRDGDRDTYRPSDYTDAGK